MITKYPTSIGELTQALRSVKAADRVLITAGRELYNFRADKIRAAIAALKNRNGLLVYVEVKGPSAELCFIWPTSGRLRLYSGTGEALPVKKGGRTIGYKQRSIIPVRPTSINLDGVA